MSVDLAILEQDLSMGCEVAPDDLLPHHSPDKPLVYLPGHGVEMRETAINLCKILAGQRAAFVLDQRMVTVVKKLDGDFALEILRPEQARTFFEKYATLMAWRIGKRGENVLKKAICPEETAKAILACEEAIRQLPPIKGIVNCPLLVEVNGRLEVAGKGYNEATGLLVTRGGRPEEPPLEEAKTALLDLLSEFDFQTPSDRSRAVASFITPAMQMGNLIQGPIPVDVAEANASQSGKTYRQHMIAAIYGEKPSLVPEKKNGVGSVDEFFMEQLIAGRPFIQFDNFRGRLDSPALESFVTRKGGFPCRIVGQRSVEVDATRFFVMLSSNGVDTTTDFANRANFVRIRKRPNFTYRDTLDMIKNRQPYYLGCVFAIVRAWHTAGKPRTNETRHDFRAWAQSLDWIVQNIFQLPPLMDGHRDIQERVANPVMNYLRAVALECERQNRLGQPLSTSQLFDLGEEAEVSVPGLPRHADDGQAIKVLGKKLGPLFRERTQITCDAYTITLTTEPRSREDGKGTRDCKLYTITK